MATLSKPIITFCRWNYNVWKGRPVIATTKCCTWNLVTCAPTVPSLAYDLRTIATANELQIVFLCQATSVGTVIAESDLLVSPATHP